MPPSGRWRNGAAGRRVGRKCRCSPLMTRTSYAGISHSPSDDTSRRVKAAFAPLYRTHERSFCWNDLPQPTHEGSGRYFSKAGRRGRRQHTSAQPSAEGWQNKGCAKVPRDSRRPPPACRSCLPAASFISWRASTCLPPPPRMPQADTLQAGGASLTRGCLSCLPEPHSSVEGRRTGVSGRRRRCRLAGAMEGRLGKLLLLGISGKKCRRVTSRRLRGRKGVTRGLCGELCPYACGWPLISNLTTTSRHRAGIRRAMHMWRYIASLPAGNATPAYNNTARRGEHLLSTLRANGRRRTRQGGHQSGVAAVDWWGWISTSWPLASELALCSAAFQQLTLLAQNCAPAGAPRARCCAVLPRKHSSTHLPSCAVRSHMCTTFALPTRLLSACKTTRARAWRHTVTTGLLVLISCLEPLMTGRRPGGITIAAAVRGGALRYAPRRRAINTYGALFYTTCRPRNTYLPHTAAV